MLSDDVGAAGPSPNSGNAESVALPEDSYASQLEKVRNLKATGASAELIHQAAERLKEHKRGAYEKLPRGTVGRKKKRKAVLEDGVEVLDVDGAAAKRDAPAVAKYPPIDFPPLDDDGFVVAFDVPGCLPIKNSSEVTDTNTRSDDANRSSEGVSYEQTVSDDAMRFFRRYGFVVFRDVLSDAQCEKTRDEIFAQLETGSEKKFNRSDYDSYESLSSVTYGLAPDPAVFSPHIVANRQNENVAKCLSKILKIDDCKSWSSNLLVSQDRWCVYRPTRAGEVQVPIKCGGSDTDIEKSKTPIKIQTEDKPEWKTRGNLHLDLNPWTWKGSEKNLSKIHKNCLSVADSLPFDSLRDFSRETNCVYEATGPHCQGLIALLDNKTSDGGLQLVPGFHTVFDDWLMGLGNDPSKYAETHDDWNHNRLVVRAEGAGSFKFGDLDTEIYRRAIRVSMREGSFVLWDQRVVHGSSPNDSHNFRVAQFIKGFRRDKVGSGRLKRRTSLIAKHLELAGEETKQVVTPLGRKLFGLE